MGMVPGTRNNHDCFRDHRIEHHPGCHDRHGNGIRLADRAKWHHGGYTWVPGAEVGRRLPALDCGDSGVLIGLLIVTHPFRRTRMDATLCVVFHYHRSFPPGCCDEAEVSQLGLGGF
jgi:hypothetical protein